jgi:hypothetical protein
MIYIKNWIDQEWFTDIYQQHKRENFEILDQYLDTPPLAILDIGCTAVKPDTTARQIHLCTTTRWTISKVSLTN